MTGFMNCRSERVHFPLHFVTFDAWHGEPSSMVFRSCTQVFSPKRGRLICCPACRYSTRFGTITPSLIQNAFKKPHRPHAPRCACPCPERNRPEDLRIFFAQLKSAPCPHARQNAICPEVLVSSRVTSPTPPNAARPNRIGKLRRYSLCVATLYRSKYRPATYPRSRCSCRRCSFRRREAALPCHTRQSCKRIPAFRQSQST